MNVTHAMAARQVIANQILVCPLDPRQRLVSVAARNRTTGYRSLPIYLGPRNQNLAAGVGLLNLALDTSNLMVLKADADQGGLTNWVNWVGSLPMGGNLDAVIVDITTAISGDIVDLLVVTE